MSGSRIDGRPPVPDCRELRAVYLRSLCLQASWNPKRMQNLGLLTTLLPWLRRQGAGADEVRRFCRDHFVYFNTNPYLANILIGGLLRLEGESRASGGGYERTVRSFKESLGRALASLGDQLFWLGLQPALTMTAVLAALVGPSWSPLVPFALFAVGQLVMRRRQLTMGHRLGMDVVDLLGSGLLHRLILVCKRGGALLAGAFAGVAALGGVSLAADPESRSAALGLVLTCALAVALRRRAPGEYVLLFLVPLAMLLRSL